MTKFIAGRLCLASPLFCASLVNAQNPGISGRVTDPSGAIVGDLAGR